jgi:hypothetical protein
MSWEKAFKVIDEAGFIAYTVPFVTAMNRGGMDTEVNNGKPGTVKEQIYGFLYKLLKDEKQAKEYLDKITKGEDVTLNPSWPEQKMRR